MDEIRNDSIVDVNVAEEFKDPFYQHDYVFKKVDEDEIAFDVIKNKTNLIDVVDGTLDIKKMVGEEIQKEIDFQKEALEIEVQKRILSQILKDSPDLRDLLFDFLVTITETEEQKDEEKGVENVNRHGQVKVKPIHYSRVLNDTNVENQCIQIDDKIYRFKSNVLKETDRAEGDKVYKLFQFDFDEIEKIFEKGNNLSLIKNVRDTLLSINIKFKLQYDKFRVTAYKHTWTEFTKQMFAAKELHDEIMGLNKVDPLVVPNIRRRMLEKFKKKFKINLSTATTVSDALTTLLEMFYTAYLVVQKNPTIESDHTMFYNEEILDDLKEDKLMEAKLKYFLMKNIYNYLTKFPYDLSNIIHEAHFKDSSDIINSFTFHKMIYYMTVTTGAKQNIWDDIIAVMKDYFEVKGSNVEKLTKESK